MLRMPGPLQDLVERLAKLPGVGPKSAMRMALTLLKWPEDQARALGRAVFELRDRLCVCSECAGLADTDPCSICSDPDRDPGLLCLVGDWDALITLEEAGFFKGGYLVLGGLISPLDGINAENLELGLLKKRLARGSVREVILALGTTLEAETTATYVKKMIEQAHPEIGVSRLAQGIPLGSDIKFMDRETLKQSMIHRQKF